MISFGETLSSARRTWGTGVSMPPGTEASAEDIFWNTWQLGLIVSDSPENLPEGAAADMVDIEVDRDNCLIRSPGATLLEDVGPRSPLYIFEHASLDFSSELVIIDPPYFGRMGGSSGFTFADLGLSPTAEFGWNIANIAGTLLFSNGLDSTYLREPGAVTVTDISSEIVAQTFATSFARTFAGAYNDSAAGIESIGIRWNAASGDPADWTGLGAGAELLISNQLESDRIVALRPIGLDVLAILTRKAVWFGYPTQQLTRPADFRLRFPANGCVSERTACVVPGGVVYLSDDGVYLVDLNNLRLLSHNISALLFPLDYSNLDKYKAVYDTGQQKYILQTPTGVFVFEFARGPVPERWFFRSIVPDSITMYSPQLRGVYWTDVPGTWADQTLTWDEMSIGEENTKPVLGYAVGSRVSLSDLTADDYDGTAQTPFWVSPQRLARITDQVSTIALEGEYRTTAEATIKLQVPDSYGVFNFPTTVTLADTSSVKTAGWIPFSGTGLGARLRLDITSGFPGIYRLRQMVMRAGQTPLSLPVTSMATKINIADSTTSDTAAVGAVADLAESDELLGVHDPSLGAKADAAWDGAAASASGLAILKYLGATQLAANALLTGIKTGTDRLPAQGQAVMAASVPVVVASNQSTLPVSAAALPLPADAATQTTLALIKAKTDNLDVALSTRSKPADNQGSNITQLAGTAVSTNSGNKDAGTLRVVLATDQPAMTSAQPVTPQATEVHLGEVGGKSTVVQQALVVNAGAYAAGYNLGGLLDLGAIMRVAAGTGVLEDICVIEKGTQKAAIDILIFGAQPASVFTDHAAFPALTQADAAKILARVSFASSDYTTVGGISVADFRGLAKVLKAAAGQHLWAAINVVAAPTFAAADAVQVNFGILLD